MFSSLAFHYTSQSTEKQYNGVSLSKSMMIHHFEAPHGVKGKKVCGYEKFFYFRIIRDYIRERVTFKEQRFTRYLHTWRFNFQQFLVNLSYCITLPDSTILRFCFSIGLKFILHISYTLNSNPWFFFQISCHDVGPFIGNQHDMIYVSKITYCIF